MKGRNAVPKPVASRRESTGKPGRLALNRTRRIAIAAVFFLLGVVVLGFWFVDGDVRILLASTGKPPVAATFVGSETCAGCHQTQAGLWQGSQHRLAMDHATGTSVLGDFSDARFTYFGVTSRFFRKGGKFLVETDGADGKAATFEIKYTFGVEPLQQYLVEFPDGRLQALSIAWDSRRKEEGGQRWFHLYPDEQVRSGDVLHWTRLNQNWNFMCAECHSTGVRKNYDAASDRFATTWAEINVGCEACHGKGSRHAAWARDQRDWWPFGGDEDADKGLVVRFDERSGVSWAPDAASGMPVRSRQPPLLRKEVETCGLCHARRGGFSEEWVPGSWLSDTHRVSPLDGASFHADGQMRDVEETYNYAPFKQSRMFARGVTCSDCHDPHSAELRAPGDGVCAQCHMPDRYEAASHSRHDPAGASPDCVSCHMPERSYMVVDRRHDHGFRIPRPDLSVKLGTPNACNDCHRDRPPEWAAAAVEDWFGPAQKGIPSHAGAFHAAWTGQAGAGRLLADAARDPAASPFIHAGALAELAAYLAEVDIGLIQAGLSDDDPMVRIGALDMLEGVPAARLWTIVSPLLSDRVRGVRLRAVSLLAVPAADLPAADRDRFERAAAEFVAGQRLNADRPEARTELATFLAGRGMPVEAEAEYRAALRISPEFASAAINLADLYRALGRDVEGEQVLRLALQTSHDDPGVRYALGLTLVRLGRSGEALDELRRAADLAPGQARYAYAHAIALNSAGHVEEAIAVLEASLARHPDDRDTLLALATLNRDAGHIAAALGYAEKLLGLAPESPDLLRLVEELRRLKGTIE